MILGIEKEIQVECLAAFAHSRLSGIAGKGQEGIEIFKNRFALKSAVNRGKTLEDAIKDLATIDTINKKIESSKGLISSQYYNSYNKLLSLMDKYIKKDEHFVEGIIGLHLLILATKKDLLTDAGNLLFYEETLAIYENENYTDDSIVSGNIKKMREISLNIFNDYWRKKKKVIPKRNKRR